MQKVNLKKNQSGAASTEIGVLLCLVALIGLVGVTGFGKAVSEKLTTSETQYTPVQASGGTEVDCVPMPCGNGGT